MVNFLIKGDVFKNNKTFYKNINVFPPGNYCQIKQNIFTFYKYWKLKDEEKLTFSNFLKFKKILKKNISKHNNYRIKTALPLSSGLDSNFLFSNFKNQKNLICYTLKNYENDFESKWVKKIFLTEILYISLLIVRKLVQKKINDFIKNLDYPIRSFQPIYQYLIAEHAKNDKVKILLSGDGSDEIFGGYRYAVPYRVSSLILQNKLNTAKQFSKEMQKFTGQTWKSLFLKEKIYQKEK